MTELGFVVDDTPEPRRRRRLPWVLLVVVLLLAALATASEVLARQLVPGIVRAQLAQAIPVEEDQQLQVEIEGMLIPQLIRGEFAAIHVVAESVTLGEIAGDIDATATGVPLGGGAIGGIAGSFAITAAEFERLLAASDLPLEEVAFAEGTVTLSGEVRVFGFGVPIAIGVEPDVVEGTIVLRPADIRLGDLTVDTQELAARLGQLGVELAGPYPVCLADRMPRAIALHAIDVSPRSAVIEFSVDGAITVDSALQQPGTCG